MSPAQVSLSWQFRLASSPPILLPVPLGPLQSMRSGSHIHWRSQRSSSSEQCRQGTATCSCIHSSLSCSSCPSELLDIWSFLCSLEHLVLKPDCGTILWSLYPTTAVWYQRKSSWELDHLPAIFFLNSCFGTNCWTQSRCCWSHATWIELHLNSSFLVCCRYSSSLWCLVALRQT